jgi:outer membrane biosynthesis protein TonB
MSDETTETHQVELPTTKIPNRDIITALWAYDISQTEKAQSVTAEVRERVTNQVELAGLNRPAYSLGKQALRKGKKHQFEAIDMCLHAILYLTWVIEEIKKQGHTGDIAEMAAKSAEQPQGSKPAEPKPTENQPEASNVVPLADAKADKRAKAAKEPKPAKEPKQTKAKTDKPKDTVDSFREQLAADNAKGDEHIKKVAAGEIPDAAAAPTPPTSTMPDIPADLDRRGKPERERIEDPENRAHGKYRLLS